MSKENKSKLNCVLKSWQEVTEAQKKLSAFGLPPHPDVIKSWDTWKIIDFINSKGTKDSYVLDVGCNGSPTLPYLKKLGFNNLYGCDVDLKMRKRRLLRRIKNTLSNINPDKLLNEMLENKDGFFHLSIQNLQSTKYEANLFNFISSLSVIEHGVNISNYFAEMGRILKPGGFLLTSTDFWPEKIKTSSNVYDRPTGDIIFDKTEMENVISKAYMHEFKLYEPIDYNYGDKVVHWKKTGNDYTFLFFCLQKK